VRGGCREHYDRWYTRGDPVAPPPLSPTEKGCAVKGCDKPHHANGYCVAHARALSRYGDPLINKTPVRKAGKYRTLIVRGHPLASPNGYVYEHRVVAYQKFGPWPQHCLWCGTGPLYWKRGQGRQLHVDHFNGIQDDNNRPENLLIACAGCNGQRHRSRGEIKINA